MIRPLNQLRRVTNCGSEVQRFSSQLQMIRQVKSKAARWCGIIFLLFLGQHSFGQGISGSVSADVTGTVLTEKGELLQGATVVARNTATNTTAYSITDDNGVFLFRKLIVGNKYDFSFSFWDMSQVSLKALSLSRQVRKIPLWSGSGKRMQCSGRLL